MKILLITCALLTMTTSCDVPQRNHMVNSYANGSNLNNPTVGTTTTNPWGTSGTTSGSASGGTIGGSTGPTPPPPGFENCDISTKYYASEINYMGLCQSSQDETSIAVKSTIADSNRTCLIPTFKDNTGSSTYLGQPQCYLPQTTSVMMGKLYKTRSGFSNYPINGVMVLKEIALNAYFTCMNAYVNFMLMPQCPNGAKTNAYCDQLARQDMATKCNNFKADYPYIDIRLK